MAVVTAVVCMCCGAIVPYGCNALGLPLSRDASAPPGVPWSRDAWGGAVVCGDINHWRAIPRL